MIISGSSAAVRSVSACVWLLLRQSRATKDHGLANHADRSRSGAAERSNGAAKALRLMASSATAFIVNQLPAPLKSVGR